MTINNFELQKALLSLNFSEKEASVYLALLELGKGTVSQIARKANINRTHGYNILDILVNKGLANISGKEPKQEYVAESPDKIKDMVRAEIKKQEEFLKEADKIIPELKSVHNVKGRPQIRFYEGKEGIQQVYEDTLTSKGDSLTIAIANDAPVITFVAGAPDPTGKASTPVTSKKVDFKDIKVGNTLSVTLTVLQNGSLQGTSVTVVPLLFQTTPK